MPARPLLRLRNFAEAAAIDNIISSSLVDVAEIERIDESEILVAPCDEVPIGSPEDHRWFREVIEQTLAQYGQHQVSVEDVSPDPPQGV